MRKQNQILKILATVVMFGLGLLFITPLLWMISSSLKMNREVFSVNFRWIPEVLQWKNYTKVLTSKSIPMLIMFKNSFYLAVMDILGQVLFCSLAAYAFAIIPFKGKNVVFLLLLAATMIPGQATMIPKFIMFKWMGLYNTHAALIFPGWLSIGSIFLLRQFCMKLPRDLVEAARVDGASHFQIWLRIMLPLTKTALTSIAILAFIGSWNNFLGPLIYLTKKDLFTVSLGVNMYSSTGDADQINLVMAASTLAIAPILVFFTVCQKQFVEGIASSGVKG